MDVQFDQQGTTFVCCFETFFFCQMFGKNTRKIVTETGQILKSHLISYPVQSQNSHLLKYLAVCLQKSRLRDTSQTRPPFGNSDTVRYLTLDKTFIFWSQTQFETKLFSRFRDLCFKKWPDKEACHQVTNRQPVTSRKQDSVKIGRDLLTTNLRTLCRLQLLRGAIASFDPSFIIAKF